MPKHGLEIARSLAYVHAQGQAHRDVKSANVLLASGAGGLSAKLCDWGSAAALLRSLPVRPRPSAWPNLFGGPPASWTPVGTLLWMAPEMLEPHFEGSPPPPGASGATADVFSLGIVLWELLERKLPWAGGALGDLKRPQLVNAVVRQGKRLPLPKWAAPGLRAIIQECWAADCRKRPTAAQVVARLEELQARGRP